MENLIKIEGVVNQALIKDQNGVTLVLEIGGWMPVSKLKEIESKA